MDFLPKKITNSWFFDIIAVVLLVVIILVFSNLESLQKNIITPLLYNIEYFFSNYDEILRNSFNLGTIAIAFGTLLVVLFFSWRIIWHLRSLDKLTSDECPRCGNHLIRIKRTSFQRTIGKVVPHRKLHCKKCRWQGIRLKPNEPELEEY